MNSLRKTVELVIASGLVAFSLFLWGQVRGFEEGMTAAYGLQDETGPSYFVTHGPNFFNFVASRYFLIAVSMIVYSISKLLRNRGISNIIPLITLLTVAVMYCVLLKHKYDIDDSAVLLYRQMLDRSLLVDWLGMMAAVILIFLHVWPLVKNKSLRPQSLIR